MKSLDLSQPLGRPRDIGQTKQAIQVEKVFLATLMHVDFVPQLGERLKDLKKQSCIPSCALLEDALVIVQE